MAKREKLEKKNRFMDVLWEVGAKIIYGADKVLDLASDFLTEKAAPFMKDILEELHEIGKDGFECAVDIGAAIVRWYDKSSDVLEWFVKKTAVLLMRKYHDMLLELAQYRKKIIKDCIIILVVGVGAVAIFASAVDYEYAYNGRTLGIVHEQREVLEILDMVSEELSLEYGSNISIDPETDITFKPVISFGKEIDDADTVLKRFTYMGDIQAQAYGIIVDGERVVTVESEKIANDVLDAIKELYTKKNKKYEYIGFVEDIKIEPYSTTLANVSSKAAAIKKIKKGGQEEVTYKVKAGDTLYGICEKLDVSLSELKKMNPKITDNMTIHIGDKFVTQQAIPLITVETVEVSVFAEPVDYKTVTKKSGSYFKGETVVVQSGKKGKARVTAKLTKRNGKTVKRKDLEVETIKEPVNKVIVKGTKPVPAKKGTGTFMRPVNAGVYAGYGMRWGRMHYGLDFSAPTGTPIYAADGGTVTFAGWSGAYGYVITIDHGANKKTLYAHCSRLFVSAGNKVYKGQHIAAVGSTGRSTGPHCHFEIFINGSNVNPAYYI
ncbi:MAG: peptidoglycan DD-metalloendopeptidase family protein [Firmicutes bacterium]|nr:peptidoglycan DD-metalloendopeptidase family protein [Bacillota bacterium]MDY5770540.1 peptidoglycan DD-metalloendopeptidase family protein [Anaerovoracaceae bacterium]